MPRILLGVDNVYLTDYNLVVTGSPIGENECDDGGCWHDCDEMGCSSCDHVLLQIPLKGVIKGYNPIEQEKED